MIITNGRTKATCSVTRNAQNTTCWCCGCATQGPKPGSLRPGDGQCAEETVLAVRGPTPHPRPGSPHPGGASPGAGSAPRLSLLSCSGPHRAAAGRRLQVAGHFLFRADPLGAPQPLCSDQVSVREGPGGACTAWARHPVRMGRGQPCLAGGGHQQRVFPGVAAWCPLCALWGAERPHAGGEKRVLTNAHQENGSC